MGKESKVRIIVQVPTNHTMEVPRGTEAMVADLFEAAGLEGEYTLFLGEFVKGAAHIQGVSVRQLLDGRIIKIRVQPGNNATSQMLKMMVPEGEAPQAFFDRLKQAEGKLEVESKSNRLRKKMRRLYRRVKGQDFSVSLVPQDAIEELDYETPEALDRMLQSLARNNFIIRSGKEPENYFWLPGFREEMLQSGYDPSADESAEHKISKEDESEEDRALSRIFEIEEEIEHHEGLIAEIVSVHATAAGQLRCAEEALSTLLRQVEEQNANTEKARRHELKLAYQLAGLKEKKGKLKGELNDLNERLAALDEERKISTVKSQAEKLLLGLSPAERANILSALADTPV